MSTAFGGRPTHRHDRTRDENLPLSELPEWGLDIMAGLYGTETIRVARSEQRRRTSAAACGAHAREIPPEIGEVAPLMLELQAVTEFGRMIERTFRRLVR